MRDAWPPADQRFARSNRLMADGNWRTFDRFDAKDRRAWRSLVDVGSVAPSIKYGSIPIDLEDLLPSSDAAHYVGEETAHDGRFRAKRTETATELKIRLAARASKSRCAREELKIMRDIDMMRSRLAAYDNHNRRR